MANRPLTLAERRKRYDATPRGKYTKHKKNAKRRGIPFVLTFDEWWAIWRRSKRWNQRGNATGDQYVMSRHGDEGPYAAGNVSIVKHAENAAERNTIYHQRPSYAGATARYKARQPGPDVPF